MIKKLTGEGVIDHIDAYIDNLQTILNDYQVMMSEGNKLLDEFELKKIRDDSQGFKKGMGLAINSLIRLKGELELYFSNLEPKGDDVL